MNERDRNVVAIDGSRGSGKSRLAGSLRARFGCGVLELGPLFRLCAWLVRGGEATDAIRAVEVLRQRLSDETIQLDTANPSSMSAMRILRAGHTSDVDLWDAQLNGTLRSLADNDIVVRRLGTVVRGLVDRTVVVVGREAGSEQFFPGAGLKILLQTDDAIRFTRKADQIGTETGTAADPSQVDDPEPNRQWQYAPDVVVIDTTSDSPSAVFERVSHRIEQQLGWTRSSGQDGGQ